MATRWRRSHAAALGAVWPARHTLVRKAKIIIIIVFFIIVVVVVVLVVLVVVQLLSAAFGLLGVL